MKGGPAPTFTVLTSGRPSNPPTGPGKLIKVEGAAVFKIFYRPEEDRLPFLQYRELICPSAQLFKAVGDKIGPSFGTRRSLSQ